MLILTPPTATEPNKKRVLPIIMLYYAITVVLTEINLAKILHYQDQFLYTHLAHVYIQTHTSLISLLTTHTSLPLADASWLKIVCLLMLTFKTPKIIPVFNATVYLFAVLFTNNYFKKNSSIYGHHDFLLPYLLLFPPSLFVNSLYLKASILSSLLLILLTSFIQRSYLISVLSGAFITMLRGVYTITIIPVFLLCKTILLKKPLIILASITFSVIFFLAVLRIFPHSKFTFYVLQTTTKPTPQKILKNKGTLYHYLNKNHLLSPENIAISVIGGAFNTPPVRFIKHPSIQHFLENIFVSIFWYLLLPFAILAILRWKTPYRVPACSAFLAIYLISSLSLLSPAPEVFRYRLPLYPILGILAFFGFHEHKLNKKWYDVYVLYSWYLGALSLYLFYLAV